jgi:plasmid stabilization system protein ParE
VYRAEFSKIIKEDIDKAHNYIKKTLEAPMAAENLKMELLEKIESIKKNPYARPLVQDKYLAYLSLRSKKVNNYLLFYKVKESDNNDKKHVYLIRFMYGKRNWIKIFKNESINELM